MADYAYPTVAHNARVVTPREYEDLTSPQAADGLIGSPSLPALVYADSSLLGVKIRANRAALIRGLRWESGDTERSLPVDPNTTPGTTRKDLVVLRQSRNPWNATPVVIKGAPAASNPVTPSPTYGEDTSTGVWDLPLAEVTIPYNDAVTDAAQCVPRAWYVGKDGQIICTSSTRPPHEPGRRWFETDTGREILSTGSDLIVVGDDSGNLALPLVNTAGAALGWSAALNNLRRRNGWVYLQLSPQRTGGNVPANTYVDLGTLPPAFRPPFAIESGVSASGTQGRLSIRSDNGLVQAYLYGGLSTSNFILCQPIAYPAIWS
ncbi:hypothetical protein ACIBTV_27425 [Micromonospora sp. NPDC049366]|uniref:hypothetical protein n=1 Tax=Micromonospora sp. NPDC049366 TaxID=3364271 RepID=UPI0037985305